MPSIMSKYHVVICGSIFKLRFVRFALIANVKSVDRLDTFLGKEIDQSDCYIFIEVERGSIRHSSSASSFSC